MAVHSPQPIHSGLQIPGLGQIIPEQETQFPGQRLQKNRNRTNSLFSCPLGHSSSMCAMSSNGLRPRKGCILCNISILWNFVGSCADSRRFFSVVCGASSSGLSRTSITRRRHSLGRLLTNRSNLPGSDRMPLTLNLLSAKINHACGVSGQKSGNRRCEDDNVEGCWRPAL
jgi:hypothetical protein